MARKPKRLTFPINSSIFVNENAFRSSYLLSSYRLCCSGEAWLTLLKECLIASLTSAERTREANSSFSALIASSTCWRVDHFISLLQTWSALPSFCAKHCAVSVAVVSSISSGITRGTIPNSTTRLPERVRHTLEPNRWTRIPAQDRD